MKTLIRNKKMKYHEDEKIDLHFLVLPGNFCIIALEVSHKVQWGIFEFCNFFPDISTWLFTYTGFQSDRFCYED
jgi:hypothetical protein